MIKKFDPHDESMSRPVGIPFIGVADGIAFPFVALFISMKFPTFGVMRLACELAAIACVVLFLRYGVKPRTVEDFNSTRRDCWSWALSFGLCAGFLVLLLSLQPLPGAANIVEIAIVNLLGFTAGLWTLIYWTPSDLGSCACANCGYDLRGARKFANGRCPECGKPIS